jgi:fumarate reductase iron-sulfur subunit
MLVMKITECLWAKTFREADAAEIGYAGCCYQDYAAARAYHPKLKFYRENTLMQGHDYCYNKWVMET